MLVYKPLSEPDLPSTDLSISIGIPKRTYKFYLKLAARFGLIWLLGLPFILNLYWYKSVTDSDPYIVQSLRTKFKSVRHEDSYQGQEMGEVITYLTDNRKDGLFLESVVGSAHNAVGPWMTDSLGWRGVIVEPEKDKFQHLRYKHANRSRVQVLNAGITNVERPTISSLYDLYFLRKEQWEYPVFTLLLGLETMNCDLLSFGGYGNELNVSFLYKLIMLMLYTHKIVFTPLLSIYYTYIFLIKILL
ncbi:S.2 family protein [Megaselia abdita]